MRWPVVRVAALIKVVKRRKAGTVSRGDREEERMSFVG
jgi:hypothetical protein